jgi:hypothetical protein
MALQIRRAEKRQLRARIAIDGPTGAGKTYTALVAATVLAGGGRIIVIDSENRRAERYADLFQFDTIQLDGPFTPELYMEAIHLAEREGAAVVVIDSLTHAWQGEGGILEMVDKAAARSRSGNSFGAWKDVTPVHRRLIETIIRSPIHVIATMRSKMEYVQQKDPNGNTRIEKVGMAPIQRDDLPYEFDMVLDMDIKHTMVVTKSPYPAQQDVVLTKPGPEFFQAFYAWLNSGAPEDRPQPSPLPTTPPPSAASNGGNGSVSPPSVGPRPWPGNTLIGKLRTFALKNADRAPTMTPEGWDDLLADLIHVCGGIDEADTLVRFLWPDESGHDNTVPHSVGGHLTNAQRSALDTWLRTSADGRYKPVNTREAAPEAAKKEAAEIVAMARIVASESVSEPAEQPQQEEMSL